MKTGMIFECGPEGADKKVCEHLARLLQPDIQISSVTLDNKPKLISKCGEAAANLLREGCERITIVWDLYPPWREEKQRPCRKEEREAVFRSLADAGVTSPPARLVCIEEELEAWLLADGRAISALLSTPAHPVRVRDVKNPERARNPKKRLQQIFQQHGRRYVDIIEAEKLARKIPDLSKIKRCATFIRFAMAVSGKMP